MWLTSTLKVHMHIHALHLPRVDLGKMDEQIMWLRTWHTLPRTSKPITTGNVFINYTPVYCDCNTPGTLPITDMLSVKRLIHHITNTPHPWSLCITIM